MSETLHYKLASEAWEFEAIHRLNYATFVEEIPQHPANPERRLVDRFHAENTYAICIAGDRLVGMIAGRSERPFSLDAKLPDLERHLPPHQRLVEVRLLAVVPEYRHQAVFARLAGCLATHFRRAGCDLALISGTLRQTRLYRHLGFRAFGPLVGSPEAPYQPMYLTLEAFGAAATGLGIDRDAAAVANFLPGPVTVSTCVLAALAAPPQSHRGAAFGQLMQQTRAALCRLSGAADVVCMLGSGTLANDAVAAQLSLRGERGLILANGEFGERLVDHAQRWRLAADVWQQPWGRPFASEAVAARLAAARPGWVWAVACETSTGMLAPLDALREHCAAVGADLCLDAVSALGTLPLRLDGVHLASGSSGKGLSAAPGLALVFHDGRLAPAGRLPRAIDLAAYAAAGSVPYTHSSNLVAALAAALDERDWPQHLQRVAAVDQQLRAALRLAGFAIVAEADAAPGIITLALPAAVDSRTLARRMARAGFRIAADSDYLVARNWVQVCLMGHWRDRDVQALPSVLQAQLGQLRQRAELAA